MSSIFTFLEAAAARHGDLPALHQPVAGGGYRTYSWAAYKEAVQEIAAGLRSLGIVKGDVVGLYSETRAEFYLADLGVLANGSIAAALYTGYPASDSIRNLAFCGARAVFVENPEALRLLRTTDGGFSCVRWILLTGEAEGTLSLNDLRAAGRRSVEADPGLFSRIAGEVTASDTAILYLTSGATAEPKMVLVTHGSLLANIYMSPPLLNLGPDDATIAFMPSAHMAQRVVVELLPIRYGMPVWFVENLGKLPQVFRSVRPTFFLAPPRLWERVYTSACIEISKRPAAVRKLFYLALGLGLEAKRLGENGKKPPAWMRVIVKAADRLVFRKLRSRFGGRLRLPISGGAPLGKELARFYEVIGMPLIEGYGLTEGGVVTLNPLDRPRAGSIGKPLSGMEARIAADGELLIRGPSLFKEYFLDPQATAEVLRDGWLHTGDIADIDAEGFIYITGRKKELIVSSSGKNIYPVRIENLFKLEPLISNVVLTGDRLPYVCALVTINPAVADTLPGMDSHRGRPLEEIAAAEPVVSEVRNAVARVNRRLAPFEQIRKFGILDRELSIERGELTATMKVRRSRVLEIHRDRFAELYAGKEESR